MKVWVCSHCRNEKNLLPWFLRHYSEFADQIHIFDDDSDDGSAELIANHPKATYHSAKTDGIHEADLLMMAYRFYPMARGLADYIIWPDLDEFVYHPDIVKCLEWHQQRNHAIIRTLGFNMMGAELPKDDGESHLWEIYRTGVRAPVYSKPIIFNPEIDIRWRAGKHHVESDNEHSPKEDEYKPQQYTPKLLHYRYLTPEYTRLRNARQYGRSIFKGAAWTNAPDFRGEHSAEWVERTMQFARDVVNDEACYLEKDA